MKPGRIMFLNDKREAPLTRLGNGLPPWGSAGLRSRVSVYLGEAHRSVT